MTDDSFDLYDLRVEIVAPKGARIYCGTPGDWFELRGEQLHLPPGPAFRSIRWPRCCRCCRPSSAHPPHDWMTTDAEVACPDPNCPTRLRITRLGKRRFSHAETTAVPLPKEAP
jgi:uncharacterized repeat protein (TIGR04076 family)